MQVSDAIRAQIAAAVRAQQSGQLYQFNVAALPLPPASGLVPVSPALLAQAVPSAPTPEQLARAARDATAAAFNAVRFGAPVVAGLGALTAAAAPLIGAAGRAVAPALNAVPYVGPALSAAAVVAEPVAAVGGTVAAAAGSVAGAAAGTNPAALVDTGASVVKQLENLAQGNLGGNPPPASGT